MEGRSLQPLLDHVSVTLLLKNTSDILDQASKDLCGVETQPLSDLARRQ